MLSRRGALTGAPRGSLKRGSLRCPALLACKYRAALFSNVFRAKHPVAQAHRRHLSCSCCRCRYLRSTYKGASCSCSDLQTARALQDFQHFSNCALAGSWSSVASLLSRFRIDFICFVSRLSSLVSRHLSVLFIDGLIIPESLVRRSDTLPPYGYL